MEKIRLSSPININKTHLHTVPKYRGQLYRYKVNIDESFSKRETVYWGIGCSNERTPECVKWLFNSIRATFNAELVKLLNDIYEGKSDYKFNDIQLELNLENNVVSEVKYELLVATFKPSSDIKGNLKNLGVF